MSRRKALTPRRFGWFEAVRVLALVAAPFVILSPFLTSSRLGGVDALWYANMIRGVTDQVSAGHFPAPVGEGAFAWNGGVHPFRSAPVFPLVAVLWHVLTLGRLGEFALQHVIALSAAVVGTLGFYVAATKLMPGRRWAAAAFAFIYFATPSWVSIVVNVEDYMSYMAFAAMPLVLYGNARSTLEPDGRGYVPLGAGLALVWMCHPPIAFLTTMATLVIQAGAAVARGFAPWRGILAGAAAFGVLAAYYFISMSELPRSGESASMSAGIPAIVGLALFFIGFGRWVQRPRNPGWAICAAAGAVMVARASHPWLIWISFSGAFWIAAALTARFSGFLDLRRNAFSLLFVCALLGAAAAEAVVGPNYPGVFRSALITLAQNTARWRSLVLPLPAEFRGFPIYQPGWALDLAVLLGALSLFGKRPLAAKLFFATSIGLVICFVRVPMVSNFLDGYFPDGFAAMCGLPLVIRIVPVIASFAAMAGLLWYAGAPARGRWAAVRAVGLALIAAWSGFQASKFIASAKAQRSSPEVSADNVRPENVALARYAYDLQHLTIYYSNGVMDPALESRLLDASGKILLGPMEAERILEDRGVRHLRLVCAPIPHTFWFDIQPGITVEPGEHLLLRFGFDPKRTYNGYLIMSAEHGYREYHLPDSGLDKAFGVGGERTPVLSLWNSGSQAEHYRFSVSREDGNDLDVNGGLFADVSISHLDVAALPIRLESLIPYRATVSTGTGGWLETFIEYLPGYRAWVDGNAVPVAKSDEALNEVRVPPGQHAVELRFVGTARLWLAACLSAAGWLAFIGIAIRRSLLSCLS